jgi:hypothetical protein
MEDLKGQAVHPPRPGRLRAPAFHPQQRQGELAQTGAQEETPSPAQGHLLRPLHPQPHRAQVGAGMRHQARHNLPVLAPELQVHAGVKVHVAHPAPHGHGHVPLRRVVADEVGDHGVQAMEGLQARVGVGAGKRKLDVHRFAGRFLRPRRLIPSAGLQRLLGPGRLFQHRHPYPILRQPDGLIPAPHLEEGSLVKLAHVLDEHDGAGAQGPGDPGLRRIRLGGLGGNPCGCPYGCRRRPAQGQGQEGHQDHESQMGLHRNLRRRLGKERISEETSPERPDRAAPRRIPSRNGEPAPLTPISPPTFVQAGEGEPDFHLNANLDVPKCQGIPEVRT